jgi:hypothetical protein
MAQNPGDEGPAAFAPQLGEHIEILGLKAEGFGGWPAPGVVGCPRGEWQSRVLAPAGAQAPTEATGIDVRCVQLLVARVCSLRGARRVVLQPA